MPEQTPHEAESNNGEQNNGEHNSSEHNTGSQVAVPVGRRGRHRAPGNPIPAAVRILAVVLLVVLGLVALFFFGTQQIGGDAQQNNPGAAVPDITDAPEQVGEPNATDAAQTAKPEDVSTRTAVPRSSPAPTDTPWSPVTEAARQLQAFETAAGKAVPGALVIAAKFGDDMDNSPVTVSGTWRDTKLANGATVAQNNARALRDGMVTAPDPLPTSTTTGTVRVAGESRRLPVHSAADALARLAAVEGPPCSECEPLVITGVTSTTMNVSTTKGRVAIPAYSYAVRGERARVVVPALAPTALLNPTPVWSGTRPVEMRQNMLPLWRTSLGRDGRAFVGHVDTKILKDRQPPADSGLCWRLFADESEHAVALYAAQGKPVGTAPCVNENGRMSVVFAKPVGERTLLDIYWERAISP